MPETRIEKEVSIEVPPAVAAAAEREAAEKGGLPENYLLDRVDLSVEWVCEKD